MADVTRLELGLGQSRLLAAYLAAIHAGAGVAVWLAAPAPWALCLSVAILASLATGLRRHALRCARGAVRHLTADLAERVGQLRYASGLTACGPLAARGFISERLVVIAVRVGRWPRRETLVMTPDAVSPRALRKLRVALARLSAA